MDAMASQKDIATQIVDGGGDYVLAIKDNHPTLHKAMSEHFDQVHEEGCSKTGARHHHTSELSEQSTG
jgi:predicted transposase YbfD/YdcC